MKTLRIRCEDVKRGWHEINAEGQVLGKLAVRAAHLLMGKEKVTYSPGVDNGDYVVVTNASKLKVTGRKLEDKLYRHHTMTIGGLIEEPMESLLARKPQQVVLLAVRRMLPKNNLGKHYLTRLKVYGGAEHPHVAQGAVRIEVDRPRKKMDRSR